MAYGAKEISRDILPYRMYHQIEPYPLPKMLPAGSVTFEKFTCEFWAGLLVPDPEASGNCALTALGSREPRALPLPFPLGAAFVVFATAFAFFLGLSCGGLASVVP
jgi:hypothetical protein